MGLSPKQQQERKNDAHVQEIVRRMNESLQKREPDKYYAKGEDYIFISYKSDDWKIVLHDIVYELVTKYGLRVYFDGSFDDHNPIWVNQFPNNMKTPNCKGVLAFIDDKYTTSYATLMELMYSQTRQASVGGKKDGEKLSVVTINLFGTLKSPDSETGIEDTGLGRDRFPDGSVNSNATKEKEIFDRTFNELVRRNILKDKIEWYQDNELYNRGCHEIMVELISTLEVNQNDYIPEVTDKESFCKSLTATIRDAVGDSVFGKIVPESPCLSETPVSLDAFVSQEPKQQPCPAEEEEQEKPATEGERTYRVKGKGDKYDALLTVTEDSRYIVRKV